MKRVLVITIGIAVLVAMSLSFRATSKSAWMKLPRLEKPGAVVYDIDMPGAGSVPALEVDTSARVAARLDDPHPAVREDAVERLAELGGTDAITGLGYALSDESDTVRRLAIEGLASIGSDEAIATLVLVLDDPDVDLRELAVDELADVGTESALTLLQAFLADQDPRVRELARDRLF
jgi:HEAT repeat protein